MAQAGDFQWLSPRSAVLHRPDALLGPNDPVTQESLLFDDLGGAALRQFTLSPILMKLIDELVVNALDASTKDENLRNIRVAFADGTLTVYNDGRGIPVTKFRGTERYIPEVIFTELNAGSNFEDVGTRFSGGRNGVGASCANIWSELFEVDVRDAATGLTFRQTFARNMSERSDPVVRKAAGRTGHVRVLFRPDYARLGVDPADPVLDALVRTRVQEAAVCAARGSVFYNERRLKGDLRAYSRALLGSEPIVEVLGGAPDVAGITLAVAVCEGGRVQGFVNGTRCSEGSHVKAVLERLTKGLAEAVKSRYKDGVTLKPATVRGNLGMVLVCRIPDPRFSSQAKDTLSTPLKDFGFAVDIPLRLFQRLGKTGILETLHELEQAQQLSGALRRTLAPKARDVNIDKYDAALWSKTRPNECTLLLTEGDSAKAFAVSGLSVVGRERFGVFPLRGVLLNPRCVPLKRALDNAEISNLLKILNVTPKSSLETLRYGKIGILTDQDADGSHICGLLMNFVSVLLPHVLSAKPDFLVRIVTPLIRATRKTSGEQLCFESLQEFEAWKATVDLNSWQLKYYKGLGTSSAREAKDIFRELARNTVQFEHRGESSEAALQQFFDDSRSEDRKGLVVGCDPLATVDYGPERRASVEDFLRLEMIHFSTYHVRRSLPSSVDGLTPARRKVLYYFFQQRDPFAEVKVAQAAPGVAQLTNYLHGENSLVESIVGLAQDHVGTNNVALLVAHGQFGSRLDRPSVHAAPRYIFTCLSRMAAALFPRGDSSVLERQEEEGELVEPKYYVPVLPVVLLNGASGIGTGFACSCPSYGLPDLVAAARAVLRGHELPPLTPHFSGFKGSVAVTERSVVTTGCYSVSPDGQRLTISELPVGKWTEAALAYYRGLVESPKGKLKILAVQNRSTDTDVHIDLDLDGTVDDLPDAEVLTALKLSTSISLQQMWMFDASGRLTHYATPEDIIRAHAAERLRVYASRREYDLGQTEARLEVALMKRRFVQLIVSEELRLQGRPRAAVVEDMTARGLAPDREGKWDHLLGMSFSSATLEHVERLDAECRRLAEELEALRRETPSSMWLDDLAELEEVHGRYLEERAARTSSAGNLSLSKGDDGDIVQSKRRRVAAPVRGRKK